MKKTSNFSLIISCEFLTSTQKKPIYKIIQKIFKKKRLKTTKHNNNNNTNINLVTIEPIKIILPNQKKLKI